MAGLYAKKHQIILDLEFFSIFYKPSSDGSLNFPITALAAATAGLAK